MSQQWGPGGGQYGGQPGAQPGGQYGGQPGAQPGGQYGQFGGQPGPYGGGQPGWNQQGGYRPQGGFGPQWGPPSQRFAPPPPKKSKLGRLFGVIALLALVALAGLVITNLTSDKSDVAYQNDDYKVPPPDKNPPPLPLPQTYEEAEQLIKSNALYTQTAPFPVRCDETKTINLDTASDAQAKEHFEAVMGCLMRVWNPPVTGAKYTLVRPTVTIYGSSITTKCGTSKINAFYCSADQQVYYSNRLAEGVPAVKGTPWGPDIVMAHEFGHAIQARTAILISAHALGQESGDEATDLEYSRRLETQADCFSGLYINAVATSQGITADDLPAIEATYVAIGDDTLTGKPNIVGNHGRGATREYWGKVGLSTSDVGKCNTFAAPASQVR